MRSSGTARKSSTRRRIFEPRLLPVFFDGEVRAGPSGSIPQSRPKKSSCSYLTGQIGVRDNAFVTGSEAIADSFELGRVMNAPPSGRRQSAAASRTAASFAVATFSWSWASQPWSMPSSSAQWGPDRGLLTHNAEAGDEARVENHFEHARTGEGLKASSDMPSTARPMALSSDHGEVGQIVRKWLGCAVKPA